MTRRPPTTETRTVLRTILSAGVLAVVLLACAGTGTAAGATWTVDGDDGGAGVDYTTIQAAVDAASAGDTIEVRSGTYVENVNVDKQLTLFGVDDGGGMPVVDGGGIGSAITLNVDGIMLEGFKATNTGDSWGDAGINVGASNCLIKNNELSGHEIDGIFLRDSSNNIISGNYIHETERWAGIYLDNSSGNVISNNICEDNKYRAIYLFSGSSNNEIMDNDIKYDDVGGILLYGSLDCVISNNTIENAKNNGIALSYSSGNTITINSILKSGTGIRLGAASNNVIYHNNLIDNTQNAYEYNSVNQWDNGAAGNYWDTYIDIDTNNDGIWDTPYGIPGGSSEDRYPLMAPYSPPVDDARQKLLLLMNQFDFYEKYESHGNDLTGDDQNKNYLSQIESDDIWMIKYPWRFSTFEDGYKFGYDANTWYDKKTRAPDGTLYFEAVEDCTLFKEAVSKTGPLGETLLKSLIENVLTLSIGSNGLYAEAPFGYNEENNANITYYYDSYAILPEVGGSLPDVNADFIGQYIYLERTHSLKMSQIDDSSVHFSWELPVDEIDTGVIPYIGLRVKLVLSGTGIDLAKGWKWGDEIRPIADTSAAKMAMNIESEISTDNPAVKTKWSATWEEDPHGMFEIVSPNRDFRDDEYVTSIFTDSKYYGLRYENGQSIVRFKLSKLKQNHLLTLAPFGWDSLKQEFSGSITYFEGYDGIVIGTTNIEIKSPVEIHLFDSDGMHFGPNIDEIPNVVYYEKNDSKYLSFPINIDRFTLLLKGLDSGTYTMIITRPLLVTKSDGTSVVTILQYEITDVTTHDEDLDYFNFNFEIINDQIKEKVQQGLDVDIAITEVLETLDMDEDGIPDIQDTELTFAKSKPTLIVPSMSKQTGDDIVFNANLHHLNEKLGGKNISFYLANKKIGSNVTDGEGNAQINYVIPNNLTTGKHDLIAAFEGDGNFSNANGTGVLNIINIAPKITIRTPEDLFVNGQVLVDADIYDANLKNISLIIDDQEVASSLPYIWDTTNFEDGVHFLQIIGVDSLGEQGLDIKLTIVNNNGYNITFLPPITTPDQFNLTLGSVLPIKFTARDNSTDEFIDDDTVNVTILNSTGNIIMNFNITNGIQINSDKEQYNVDFNTMDYPKSTLGENCAISVTFGCVDNLRGIAIAYFTLEEDFTPPLSITHPHPTAGTTWLNWTWTNPTDPDFNHTEIYLDGVFRTITPAEHYNATDLTPETSYTISTRTVDAAGNINQSWANDTATTLTLPAPPSAASSSATGAPKDAYRVHHNVYAAGSGFTTSTNADIYVVPDRDWNDGDPIPADVTSAVETATVADGEIAPVLVWHARLTPGEYDIVIDANRNGDYDAATDGLDSGSPGFVVLASPPPTPPTDVPTLMSHGIIALVGLLCVVGASRIRKGFN